MYTISTLYYSTIYTLGRIALGANRYVAVEGIKGAKARLR